MPSARTKGKQLKQQARRRTVGRSLGQERNRVAELSASQISEMTIGEMIDVLKATQPPFLEQKPSQQPYSLDGASLEQLVYMARRYCRNRDQ